MTGEQRRLSRRVLEVLAREVGLTDRMLAERLGVTTAELTPVIGMLLGTRRIDRCHDYLVPSSAAGAREVSAA